MPEEEWTDEENFDWFEVTRQGDQVMVILSSDQHEAVRVQTYSLSDAETIGLAMFHASQAVIEEDK